LKASHPFTTGLDPVVDDEAQLSMDFRIKSANDEDGASFRDKRVAHAVRESPDWRSRSRTRIHLVNPGCARSRTILPMLLLDWFEL
jgi:hypothetical protein